MLPRVDVLVVPVAVSRDGKLATATLIFFGFNVTFKLASVTNPNVPSDATNNRVRSYPALDFLGRWRVWIIVPSARTTVRPKTQSFIFPYR